jgi:hypothetical protein
MWGGLAADALVPAAAGLAAGLVLRAASRPGRYRQRGYNGYAGARRRGLQTPGAYLLL